MKKSSGRRVLLHIGTHKTGSSSIQATFDGYRDGNDFAYGAMAPTPNHGFHISRHLDYVLGAARQSRSPDAVTEARLLESLETELNSPVTTLFYSGEAFSTMSGQKVEAFLDLLTRSGRDVHVLCYLRDPISWPGSAAQQWIKASFWCKTRLPAIRYSNLLSAWMEHLPADHITLRKFDRDEFQNGSLIEDVCLWAGIDPTRLTSKAQNSNEAISDGATRLLYQLNAVHSAAPENASRNVAYRNTARVIKTTVNGGPKFKTPVQCMSEDKLLKVNMDWLAKHTSIDFRPEVEAALPLMRGQSFAEEMSRIDPAPRAQFDAALSAFDLPANRDTPIRDAVSSLYLDFCQREERRRRFDRPLLRRAARFLKKHDQKRIEQRIQMSTGVTN